MAEPLNDLLRAISHNHPSNIALRGTDDLALTYAELNTAINSRCAAWAPLVIDTPSKQRRTMALAVDNHPAWVVLDLAAMRCNIPLVPLPF